jgi:hypothetical protein
MGRRQNHVCVTGFAADIPEEGAMAEIDSGPKSAESKAGESNADDKRRLESQLDEGLRGTFPGSDPVSVIQPAASKYDRRRKRKDAGKNQDKD